jgi:hypothetical protein
MRAVLGAGLLSLASLTLLIAQGPTYSSGQMFTVNATLSATCNVGETTAKSGAAAGLYFCTATNTWTQLSTGSGAVPAGLITLILSGTCPATWTEVSALNGKMIRGTIAANADVGTTGGSDSVTPTFTGNSVASSLVSAGTPAGTNGTGTVTPLGTIAWPAGVPTYTGTVNTLAVTAHTVVATKQGAAAGNVVTTATHAITGIPGGTVAWPAGVPTLAGSSSVTSAEVFTGSALGTHSHTTTATGTISAVDTRAAYVKAIFCSKN